ncbi:hypothetical protein D3C81_552330 [compost metagenome]
MRVLVGMGQQADLVQQRIGTMLAQFARLAVVPRCQGDVVENGAVREQVEVLEHHADVPHAFAQAGAVGFVRRFDEFFAEQQNVAGIDGFQAVDGADQRRLAGAGWPDDRDHLAVLDIQVDAHQHLVGAIAFLDVLQLQDRRRVVAGGFARSVGQGFGAGLEPGDGGCVECVRLAEVQVQVALQALQEITEHGDDQHVIDAYRRQGFHDQEVGGIEALADREDFGQGDDRDQRCQLDHRDVFIDQRGQRNTECLGDHDQALHAEQADTQRAPGFLLAFGHGDQATTMDFRHVRRFSDHQGQQARVEGVGQNRSATGKQLRQVVDEDHQHQQRDAAEEPDVDRCGNAQQGRLGQLGRGQDKTQQHADEPGQGTELDYRDAGLPEVREGEQG